MLLKLQKQYRSGEIKEEDLTLQKQIDKLFIKIVKIAYHIIRKLQIVEFVVNIQPLHRLFNNLLGN